MKPNEKNLLTREGYLLLEKRLQKLERELAEVSRGKTEAAETGGNLWHDNPAYEKVEAKQRMLMHEISEVKSRLSNAEIVGSRNGSAEGIVAVGSKVEIRFSNGKNMSLTIGDPMTAAPELNIVSYESPIVSALMGAKNGERRACKTGERSVEVTVVAIK